MATISIFEDDEWCLKLGRLYEEGDEDKSGLFGGRRRGVAFTRLSIPPSEPRPSSSRPAMGPARSLGGGRQAAPATFHFAHSGVRRGEGFSADGGCKAGRFQLYIEREIVASDWELAPRGGRDAAVARRRAREGGLLRDARGDLSFGSASLGDSPAERSAFWLAAAGVEKLGNARVQGRIIAEMPHWLGAAMQRRIVQDWAAAQFGSRGLAWWACVHEPDTAKGSDPRNVHLHLVYSDRPVERVAARKWKFARTKLREARGRLFPWGTQAPSVRIRRLRDRLEKTGGRLSAAERDRLLALIAQAQAVLSEAHAARESGQRPGPGWVKRLRHDFARAVNAQLEREAAEGRPVERLYDARSYREAGVEKPPGEHVGPRGTYLERAGLPVPAGARNRRRERAWHVVRGARQLVESAARLGAASRRIRKLAQVAERLVAGNSRRPIAQLLRQAQGATAASSVLLTRERGRLLGLVGGQGGAATALASALARTGGEPGWWQRRRREWAESRLAGLRRSLLPVDGRGRPRDEMETLLAGIAKGEAAGQDAPDPALEASRLRSPQSVERAQTLAGQLDGQVLMAQRDVRLERAAGARSRLEDGRVSARAWSGRISMMRRRQEEVAAAAAASEEKLAAIARGELGSRFDRAKNEQAIAAGSAGILRHEDLARALGIARVSETLVTAVMEAARARQEAAAAKVTEAIVRRSRRLVRSDAEERELRRVIAESERSLARIEARILSRPPARELAAREGTLEAIREATARRTTIVPVQAINKDRDRGAER